jgi:FtsP/CotA-like multicopper oxidase with cupredoxin domain
MRRHGTVEGFGRNPATGVARPEAFFDTNLVNGAPYPTLKVSPRRYRFQTLNAAQARFYNLQLYVADRSVDGITLTQREDRDNNGNRLMIPTNPAGPKIIQIGKDSGLLPAPVVLNDPPKPIGYLVTAADDDPRHGNANRYNLLLAPGERADLIVDFRGFEGQSIILYNDAPAPFPWGDIRNDYYADAPNLTCIGGAAPSVPGEGPDTRIVMRFDVDTNGAVNEPNFDQTLANLQTTLPAVYLQTLPPTPETQSRPRSRRSTKDSITTAVSCKCSGRPICQGTCRRRLISPHAERHRSGRSIT